SGRLWFKPNSQWAFQVSTGHIVSPERFEPGDLQRTTASASWTRTTGGDIDAVTVGFGINDQSFEQRQAVFVEGAHHTGRNTVYGRAEIAKLELHIAGVTAGAFTIGAVRDILTRRGFESG